MSELLKPIDAPGDKIAGCDEPADETVEAALGRGGNLVAGQSKTLAARHDTYHVPILREEIRTCLADIHRAQDGVSTGLLRLRELVDRMNAAAPTLHEEETSDGV